MRRFKQSNTPFIYTTILYIAGLLLFFEWLYPIEEVTDTAYIGVFILYTLLCCFITLLQVKWWITVPVKGFGIIVVLHGIFASKLPDKSFLGSVFSDLMFNVEALIAREWFNLTDMFRTLLFLLVIWLMSYLLYYWFVQMKHVLVFSILTFIFVTLLDTFTVYQANWAIFRTFVISFLALGLANVLKEMQRENIQSNGMRVRSIWILPLIAMVLFSSMVGYTAPKFEAQWPDPVPFLKSASGGIGGVGGFGIQKVGYGEDDSRLGGSFVQDYSSVFQAYMTKPSYFRIESKDVYTGKGWITSDNATYSEQAAEEISLETFDPALETEQLDVSLVFSGDTQIPKLIYPYGIRQVELGNPDVSLLVNENSGEIRTELLQEETSLEGYRIEYDYPAYPIDTMREELPIEDPELLAQYTQLPQSLPDRITELAQEITINFDSPYDKVRAVESYFSANGYEYQTTDVAVPGINQDYVDQFLFETKVGYCDNFSSAMVVMLRTLDIPARWVKGFKSGEKAQENIDDSGYDVYQVTNANAHSWVEVYFPQVGWVPFEPTQGFDVPNDFAVDTSNDEEDPLEAPEVQQQPEKPEQAEEEAVEVSGQKKDTDSFTLELTWVHGVIAAVILLLVLVLAYWKRYQIQVYFIERKIRKRQDAATYQQAYHYVLKLLKHKGFSKKPDQTLREFAKRIDSWYGSDEMGRLTANYERLIYQNGGNLVAEQEMSNLWKNLINRILG